MNMEYFSQVGTDNYSEAKIKIIGNLSLGVIDLCEIKFIICCTYLNIFLCLFNFHLYFLSRYRAPGFGTFFSHVLKWKISHS